jgi:hypothetical protein
VLSSVDTVARIVDQRDQRATSWAGQRRSSIARAPSPDPAHCGSVDDFVDIGNRDGEANQHMGPFARLAQAGTWSAG